MFNRSPSANAHRYASADTGAPARRRRSPPRLSAPRSRATTFSTPALASRRWPLRRRSSKATWHSSSRRRTWWGSPRPASPRRSWMWSWRCRIRSASSWSGNRVPRWRVGRSRIPTGSDGRSATPPGSTARRTTLAPMGRSSPTTTARMRTGRSASTTRVCSYRVASSVEASLEASAVAPGPRRAAPSPLAMGALSTAAGTPGSGPGRPVTRRRMRRRRPIASARPAGA